MAPVNGGFDCPKAREALLAVTVSGAGVMESAPGTNMIVYFCEVRPEHVMG
jgi:hypothetical protein